MDASKDSLSCYSQFPFLRMYIFFNMTLFPCFAVIPSLKRGFIVYASNSSPPGKLNYDGRESRDVRIISNNGSEPFRGKSGSVSFQGITHQMVEESKLVSAPFEEKRGSFLWVLAPIALISSLVLPRFFIAVAVDDLIKNATFAGM